MQFERKVLMSGRLNTVDLLVLTTLDQLLLELKILFTSFTKQAVLMRRSTVLTLPPQLVFHDCEIIVIGIIWIDDKGSTWPCESKPLANESHRCLRYLNKHFV
jgi:hypothetical protein